MMLVANATAYFVLCPLTAGKAGTDATFKITDIAKL
jgi:hypothetical protein